MPGKSSPYPLEVTNFSQAECDCIGIPQEAQGYVSSGSGTSCPGAHFLVLTNLATGQEPGPVV